MGYIISMTEIFDIISDPTRRKILDLLLQRPHLVGELVDELNISQPGVSKQLRILREAGLVSVQRDGQRRWYVLQAEPLSEIDHWLAGYRKKWSDRHNRLDAYLQQLQAQEQREQDDDG